MTVKIFPTASPASRSVLMTAAALNLKPNLIATNTLAKDQFKPEFLKLNPQHSVPTLVDNDFVVWESRAICVYLVEKYGKNDALFPKNPKTRAVINQRLFFDIGTLFKQFQEYYLLPAFQGAAGDPETLKKLNESLGLLNGFIEPTGFTAGTKKFTVSDFVLYATVSSMEVFDFDFTPFPEVKKWLEVMSETAPGRDQNSKGLEQLKELLKKK